MNNPTFSILAHAHQYLLNDIDSYTLDINRNKYTGTMLSFLKALTWYDPLICKIEYIEPEDESKKITADLLSGALTEGITVSAYTDYKKPERMQELIAMGVTEFTENNFCSFGLNW